MPVPYRKILVAYNGAPESRAALEEAARIAGGEAMEVHVAAVMNTAAYLVAGEYVPEMTLAAGREELESDVKEAEAKLKERGLNVRSHLVIGEPVDVIARLVDSLGVDLLILGHSRAKSFAMRWWRGSVDALMIERVRCSILIAADLKA
ncbi:MAG TPA: universal stress protein [Casimicrobiaceae bacterium]|nr:universal stress protein [Casimicrobiaceae bacterium]